MDGESFVEIGRRGGCPRITTPELCDKEGAAWLAQRIEDYWKARGYQVQTVIHETLFNPAIRSCRYDVRSDIKNGFPTKKIAA